MTSIKIYYTNLAKYNNGELSGKWLDLSTLSAEELQKETKNILGSDEEGFITDYEAPFKIGEYDNPETLRRIAETIADFDDYKIAGLIYLIDNCGESIQDAIDKVDDINIYQADSWDDLVQIFIDDG